MASTWAAHLWKEEPCRAIWAGTSALFLYSPLAEHQSSSYLPPAAGGGQAGGAAEHSRGLCVVHGTSEAHSFPPRALQLLAD